MRKQRNLVGKWPIRQDEAEVPALDPGLGDIPHVPLYLDFARRTGGQVWSRVGTAHTDSTGLVSFRYTIARSTELTS